MFFAHKFHKQDAVLSQGEPRSAAVNFDRYRIFTCDFHFLLVLGPNLNRTVSEILQVFLLLTMGAGTGGAGRPGKKSGWVWLTLEILAVV